MFFLKSDIVSTMCVLVYCTPAVVLEGLKAKHIALELEQQVVVSLCVGVDGN